MVAPLALSPSVPPGPGPVNLLNAGRALFHVHPPHSVAMLMVRLHPNPNRAFCGGQRSVVEPTPRVRTTGPGYRACKPWDRGNPSDAEFVKMVSDKNVKICLSHLLMFLMHLPFLVPTFPG